MAGVGDGGALATDSAQYAAAIRSIKQYGWDPHEKYRVLRLGQNSRMDEIQAAILSYRLQLLDDDNQKRIDIAMRFSDALDRNVGTINVPNDGSHVAHLCVVNSNQKETLTSLLEQAGIQTMVHYPLLDVDQPVWREMQNEERALPIARNFVGNILSVPNSPSMSELEIEDIEAVLKQGG